MPTETSRGEARFIRIGGEVGWTDGRHPHYHSGVGGEWFWILIWGGHHGPIGREERTTIQHCDATPEEAKRLTDTVVSYYTKRQEVEVNRHKDEMAALRKHAATWQRRLEKSKETS